MKIRYGFVTNSSSTSYMLMGTNEELTPELFRKALGIKEDSPLIPSIENKTNDILDRVAGLDGGALKFVTRAIENVGQHIEKNWNIVYAFTGGVNNRPFGLTNFKNEYMEVLTGTYIWGEEAW